MDWIEVSSERGKTSGTEERKLKHVSLVTSEKPAPAALWQEIICYTNQTIANLLEQKGGMLPIVNYVSTKCDLPSDEEGA